MVFFGSSSARPYMSEVRTSTASGVRRHVKTNMRRLLFSTPTTNRPIGIP
jgi:hypothetical protein